MDLNIQSLEILNYSISSLINLTASTAVSMLLQGHLEERYSSVL